MAVWYFVGVLILVATVAMVTGMYWNSRAVRANLTALKAFGYASAIAFGTMPIISLVYQPQMRLYEQMVAWMIGLIFGSPFAYGIILVSSQNTANNDRLEVVEKGLIWDVFSGVMNAIGYLVKEKPTDSIFSYFDFHGKSLCKNSWVIMVLIGFLPCVCLITVVVTAVLKTAKIVATIIGCAFGWYIHWDWKLVVEWKSNFPEDEFTSLWKKRFCPIQPLLVLGTANYFMRILHTSASADDFFETSRWLLIFALALGVNIMLVANAWVARFIEKKARIQQERIAQPAVTTRPHSRVYNRVVSFVVAPVLLCDRELTFLHTKSNAFADDAKQRCATFWQAILDFKDKSCPTIK